MKNFKKVLLSGLFLLAAGTTLAQGKIKGKVIHGSTNTSLPGANVVVKGSKTSTSTDFDGKFVLNASTSSVTFTVSSVGFQSKTVTVNVNKDETKDIGTISLGSNNSDLDEVVIVGKGIIDLAKDRKTPIAVSTIKASEIQAKVGSADITQTMVNMPSVHVNGQAGGFGDSRMSVRGFQQDNTAFLLNGQPINGMEDGKMYWSNWSGMSDIASAIQVQRGLGSSKLAISSVGGTVNFVTKATDMKEGGVANIGVANDNYFKSTIAYNTGLSKGGFGTSVMLSNWRGDGFNDGTRGAGQTYFISFGYKPNDRNNFNFLITGAPQFHDQNFTKRISDYLGFGKKYNNNYGYLNGRYLSERTNFYHKPVANFNWDLKINDKMDLSTVVYASWGRGGGTGNYGAGKRSLTQLNPYTNANQSTYINYDLIFAQNSAVANGAGTSANYVIRASMNNHAWYGVVSNLKTKLSDNLSLNLGLDLRTYDGTHYRQVADFVGLKSWTESRKLFNQNHVNNLTSSPTVFNTVNESLPAEPWRAFTKTLDENQRIDYDYSETISYGGLFGQLEYSTEKFSAFFQGAVSNQTHQRFDRYDYIAVYQDSEKVSNIGYNVKAGGSFKINENNQVYANVGHYSRQPYHDNVYLNFTNRLNPLTKNEKILGLEFGYTFTSKIFTASLNAYKTNWVDRVISTSSVQAANGIIGTTPVFAGEIIYRENQGVKQDHSGLELDFVFKPIDKLDIKGFGSYGNWKYVGNAITTLRNEALASLLVTEKDVDGGEVGDAAQTSYGIGLKYEVLTRFSIDADWRGYDRLFANTGAIKENLMLPTYNLLDAGISYKMLVGRDKSNSVNFRINMNNVLDTEYLSEISSSTAVGNVDGVFKTTSTSKTYNGIDDRNNAYFGFGRTWNFGITYKF